MLRLVETQSEAALGIQCKVTDTPLEREIPASLSVSVKDPRNVRKKLWREYGVKDLDDRSGSIYTRHSCGARLSNVEVLSACACATRSQTKHQP